MCGVMQQRNIIHVNIEEKALIPNLHKQILLLTKAYMAILPIRAIAT